jgi:hypothetical protein
MRFLTEGSAEEGGGQRSKRKGFARGGKGDRGRDESRAIVTGGGGGKKKSRQKMGDLQWFRCVFVYMCASMCFCALRAL